MLRHSSSAFAFTALLTAALSAAYAAPTPAQQSPAPKPDLDARVRELAERCMQRSGANGLALAVRSAGNEALRLELGTLLPTADTKQPRVDARALVEPLIAVAAWQQVAAGKWKPDQRMHALAPELGLAESDATLAQFLAHTAGLANPFELATAEPKVLALPLAEYAARIAALPRATAPGECFAYSDAHVYALSVALAHALAADQRAKPAEAGATAGGARGPNEPRALRGIGAVSAAAAAERADARAWIAEHIVAAAGLDPELLAPSEATQRAFGWQRVGGADHESCAAHALGPLRFELTLDELARLGEALATEQVLAADAWNRMSEPARERDGVLRRVAHGVTLAPLGEVPGYLMGGAVGETRVHVALYPEARLALALALDGPGAENGHSAAELERGVVRLLLGTQPPPTTPLPLPAEKRATYLGIYGHGCDSYRVIERDEQLEFVPPRGDQVRLVHVGAHEFASAIDPEVRLKFRVVEGRVADEVVLDEHGVTSVLRRVP
ncbi:MAG: hypothetical protein EPO68_15680 [Planctomycetota bacterium]|nr:MAG: hypothetical protein EPO68_15680 [Planctomycetota bacterium]